MLAVSFRVPQVSVMPVRILLSATLVIFFVLVSFVSAEERTVAEFVDYSSRRISNADLELIKQFAKAVDRNGDGMVSDEEFAGRIDVYQTVFETVKPKRAQVGHSLPDYWVSGFEKGIAESKKTGRPMLVMFSASWCAPCKMMIAKVFPDDKVKAALKNMVPVYVDSEIEVAIAKKNGIQAYPTFVCFSPAGKTVSSRVGGGDVSKFLEMIETFKLASEAVNGSGD